MAKNIEPQVFEYSFVQVLLKFYDNAKLLASIIS